MNVLYKGHVIDELFVPEKLEPDDLPEGCRPTPSFFPTNKELGIIVADDAGTVPPMPSYGGKE